jgi:hypothetical protein
MTTIKIDKNLKYAPMGPLGRVFIAQTPDEKEEALKRLREGTEKIEAVIQKEIMKIKNF